DGTEGSQPMQCRPLHRARRPRIRRLAGGFVVLVGVVAPLSLFARSALAGTVGTCDAATHKVTLAAGGTVRIVRAGGNITVPGCGGSGAILGAVGAVSLVTIEGGGSSGTLEIDLTGGHFPSSVKFDVNLGSG